jgi:hypothetical protein
MRAFGPDIAAIDSRMLFPYSGKRQQHRNAVRLSQTPADPEKGQKMNKILSAALTGLTLFLLCSFANAADTSRCTDISVPKAAIEARKGRWIELTPEQWQFLRGVFVLNPNTPPGLPYGDKAVLAQIDGDPGGLVFFIDGERACTPMAVPGVIVGMMRDVAAANISHEANGL